MRDWDRAAYSRRHWFWSVNLVAVLAALSPFAVGAFWRYLQVLPFYLVASLFIAWVFVALPLAHAMRRPASYLRAALWVAGLTAAIALVGFVLARVMANGQVGAGALMQLDDGRLTAYGWRKVLERNGMFIGFGMTIALITRAIIGPGRSPS
ncbi:hypothetical protein ACS3SW_01700 [Roseobacteraceae bacterium S113]